jgi:pimeloyl-ACP methyl ester carboxylesterase
LWGAEDRWVPIEFAYRFKAEMPHARLVLYKNVGHLPMEEIPHISIREATHFLTTAEVTYDI